ncbi:MAG: Na+/H+ antiporter NhaA [Hyphomicrobiaceae bacterium]
MSVKSTTAATPTGLSALLHHEAAGGVILLMAAALALAVSNSPLSPLYDAFLDVPLTVKLGTLGVDKPLLLWINDGLMAIFFFLVGLEIKRELLAGDLASFDRAVMPALAALGGMAAPAAIYVALNANNPAALKGWAIPSATDIAFAVGLLAVLGSRVPAALKVFLLALAIIDDLGAIVIIAVFYTADLSQLALALAGAGTVVLVVLNRRGVASLAPYLLVGLFIWLCVLKSGVHATLAGVIVALAVPLYISGDPAASPLRETERKLHPWVAFGVLPLFAFANAGVSLSGFTPDKLLASIPLGITLGLLIGKPLGIVASVWLAVKLGIGAKPEGGSWLQLTGVGFVAGIGFTMSLFIGLLAFPDPSYAADVRIGVLAGSLLSATAGYLILRLATQPSPSSK